MQSPQSLPQLEALLSQPSPELLQDHRQVDGDLLILGLGGTMGPSLARLALRALAAGGIDKRVIGVSRFSNPKLKKQLAEEGIEIIAGDLLDESFLQSLPQVKNIIYMAGQKFGTAGHEAYTWAMNTYLPGRVADHFRDSRIVAFSSGNVYPFVPIDSKGAQEQTKPNPVGEYAQSCLGRERMFEHFSLQNDTPVLLYRLNYAVDLRYGVLCDVARAVWEERPIDLRMGYANVIWQGDANAYALRCLRHCTSPAKTLNVTGPEKVSVQELAFRFGELMNKNVRFVHESAPNALLNDASHCFELMGKPRVGLDTLIEWQANWVKRGLPGLDKPTHFQEREGRF
jgi:hypothetical protein